MILQAAQFAREAHGDQRRKGGRPYVEHPARVAARVLIHPEATETMVVAALLHDVVEDTAVEIEEIARVFGDEVAAMVQVLTNPPRDPQKNRRERKAEMRTRLAAASREVRIIKLLDRIDNLNDSEGVSLGFLAVYLEESRLLAEAIGDADPVLKEELLAVIAHKGNL